MRWPLPLAAALVACGGPPAPEAPMKTDLVLVARRVIPLDDAVTLSSEGPHAVAISGGRITWVGDAAAWRGPEAERVDLGDAVVVPGLVDSHAHLVGLGMALGRLDLRGARSPDEVADRVRAAPAGEGWILGRGWDQNDWPTREFPDHAPLTAASPERPVALRRIDGHAVWVNRKVLEIAGIDATTPDPPGGRIVRDGAGQPTGVLVDAAMTLVDTHEPAPTPAQIRGWIERAVATCHEVGLTGVHDAGSTAAEVAVYRQMEAEGALPLRVHVLLSGDDPAAVALMAEGPERGPFVNVAGLKLYADGALGSRGAWLLAPYADQPDTRGIPIVHGEALRARVKAAYDHGFQVGVHAIGDAAARDVVDVYADVLKPGDARRFRMEHAQVVHPDDQARMATLGVIAMVQPTHATSDMDWAERRLGPERVRHAYAWRSLRERGVRLSLGSDFPVERPHPVEGLHAAVARGGWYMGEALTAEEALRGFTVDAAYAGFDEARRGRVAPGLDADLTILGGDPLTVAPEALKTLPIRGVVVAGRYWPAASAPASRTPASGPASASR